MIGTTSPLPTTGYLAIDWIILLGAVSAALVGIWRTVVRPTVRAYAKIDEYGPVLEEIAKQFKSDSGSTLKDTINRLEVAAKANLIAIQTNLNAITAAEERAKHESAAMNRMETALAVLEGRLTGNIRQQPSESQPLAQVAKDAEAAADKLKAVAADVAALVQVVNPDPIKVEVINPNPIDVNVNEPLK